MRDWEWRQWVWHAPDILVVGGAALVLWLAVVAGVEHGSYTLVRAERAWLLQPVPHVVDARYAPRLSVSVYGCMQWEKPEPWWTPGTPGAPGQVRRK